jgi:hypothetical protein
MRDIRRAVLGATAQDPHSGLRHVGRERSTIERADPRIAR